MSTRNFDLKLVRGDTFDWVLTFKKAGIPIDITGWKVFFTIKLVTAYKEDNDDNSTIYKKTYDITNGTSGQVELLIIPEESTKFEPGNYKYDIQYIDTTDKVETPFIGDFIVEADVTRRTL